MPILTRDYNRESVVGTDARHINYINQHRAKELAALKKKYGPHEFPKTAQEYQQLLYNEDTGQAMHAYVNARKQHTVEPVVSYKDYVNAKKQLDQEIVGMTTSTGQVIKSYSDHTFDRIFGVRKDPHGNRRIGVSIHEIKEMFTEGRAKRNDERLSTTFHTVHGYVVVNDKGKIVTLVPRKG
ncbi:hypothetical protein [Ligilactobacillus agilis]|uniref:hypothetical protein n=1 Tax=Ligilactobacillus agilis TaxID=1601 RepID=UPI0022E24604|nr:hypothetical protein [Ligilactobacillus agilis]